MLLDELTFHVDFKRKTMHIYHEDGISEKVTLDEEGAGVLKLSMFKSYTLGTLKGFIEKLNELLTRDQIQTIFQLWGDSNAVKISIITAQLDGDRVLAKQVIDLALKSRVLAVGVNSTYKIVNKEEQKTMKEHAEKLKRGVSKEPESLVVLNKRMTEEGQLEKGTLKKGHEASTKTETYNETKNSHIEVIPKEAIEQLTSEKDLRKALAVLQQKLKDDKDWNEDETPWTVNDKIHLIQNQLKGIESQRSAIQYKKDVNTLNILEKVKLTPKPIAKGIVPTRKPLNTHTSVVKKRS